MAVFKVKATYSIDLEVDIDAETETEALDRFYRADARDMIDNGMVIRADSDDETAELIEGTFAVHVSSVDYEVTFNDCWDIVADEHPGIDEDSEEFDKLVNAKIDEIKNKLPQTLDIEVDCAVEDLDDYVAEKISDITNWLITHCEYTYKLVK